tara:strand:+ start:641 stop:1600 length:960 start_codon:yes stop_codon:yes gene_type:complete
MKITKESGIPLIGYLAFGIIDRGTNLLQVRASSACNFNCVYCSTDSGPKTNCHKTQFEVELNYLVEEVKKVVDFKGEGVEINIDSVGEPLMYKDMVQLVKACKEMKGVYKVSMQTNGSLLTDDIINNLKLDVINYSFGSFDEELACKMFGVNYNVKKALEDIEKLIKKGITVRLCPVWVPGLNDEEIPKIIEYSKRVGAELGIQKYEIYKYSRKVKGVKPLNWWKFGKKLEEWEKEFDVKLKMTRQDVKIVKMERVPEVFKKGERTQVKIVAPGWYDFQMVGVARDRCVAVNNCEANIGDLVNIKILETNNNLYLGELL